MEKMFSLILFAATCVITSSAKLPPRCGRTPIAPEESEMEFIVGGKPAIPYSWPWQVALCIVQDGDTDSCFLDCGGSIIDENWIMTAAHCARGTSPSFWKIKAGAFNYLNNNETGAVFYNLTKVVVHPLYGSPNEVQHSNDIALLKVDRKIKFNKHIQPICIPKNVSDLVHVGKSAFVTGWGRINEGIPDASGKLLQVEVPFLEMDECKKEYQTIDDTMECAGKEGLDSCQGDSGGPLVTKHTDGRWFQAGITSWGDGCAERGHAGVYSRPSANCEFIKDTIGYSICQ